jgi:large subunit ribosomal protein L21
MYAIVEIAGQQFKVEKDKYLYTHRLSAAEGEEISFESVLLIDRDGQIEVGTPTVSGVKVSAKVLAHVKADKVIIFKKKRRKGYQKQNGHRQALTKILIQNIG